MVPERECPSGKTHYHMGEVEAINKHKEKLFSAGLQEVCSDLGKSYEDSPFKIVRSKRKTYIADIICVKCETRKLLEGRRLPPFRLRFWLDDNGVPKKCLLNRVHFHSAHPSNYWKLF